MSPRLELQLDTERCVPGDTVKGTVVVVEGGKCRSLRVWLEYQERSTTYETVERTVPGETLSVGDLSKGARFPFAVQLPEDALPDFRSEHGELAWRVHAESDKLGLDSHVRKRVFVTRNPV